MSSSVKLEVTALVAINSGNEVCIKIKIENGENKEERDFTVLIDQYSLLRIKKGEIDRFQFDEIERASNICSAYKKGLYLLGYGACSEKKLIYKLRTKGFDNDTCTEAVAMLSQCGYINEGNDALREAERCVAKLWGKKRIIAHLYSKGFGDEAVKQAHILFEDVDFTENCRKLILRDHKNKLDAARTDEKERQKLFASLVRMGYSFSEIKEASAGITAD